MSDTPEGDAFVRVADIEIDAVAPAALGFLLTGRGQDRADYRLEMTIEMPMNPETRAVVAELLSQSDFRLSRRARPPLGAGRARKAAPSQG
jgi:hypothetical protein